MPIVMTFLILLKVDEPIKLMSVRWSEFTGFGEEKGERIREKAFSVSPQYLLLTPDS
jgi:hypothetical protein